MPARTRLKPAVIALFVVYVASRVVLAYLADHPEHYGTPTTKIVGDVQIYEGWATAIVDAHRAPYSQIAIEYPPGALPFALGPKLARWPGTYRLRFIVLMLLVDGAGLAGLLVLSRRWGSTAGCWLWVVGVAAVGPIMLLRLDLVPAVATIWAVERAAAGRWGGTGAALAGGFLVKVYPLFLLPVALVAAPRRRALGAGFALATSVALLPFVRALGDLFRSVVEYHAQRGLQIESLWATILLFAGHFGYATAIEFNFGAFHLASGLSTTFKTVADVLSLTAVGAGAAVAWRAVRRSDRIVWAELLFGTLACIMALGTVFSPQFMLWVLALAAAVACAPRSAVRIPALLVVPLCALTQVVYPFLYDHLTLRDAHELEAIVLLLVRDAGLLAIGIAALVLVWRGTETCQAGAGTSAR